MTLESTIAWFSARHAQDIHFKPYTEEEFVEIVVNVLDREEGTDRDIALLIADGVYNRLKSSKH